MTSRNSLIDVVKGVLIFLVVFGHILEQGMAGSSFARHIYAFIYAFHMPVFVFTSGYLLCRYGQVDHISKKVLVHMLLPLVSFEIIYELFYFVLNHKFSFYIKSLAPHWILWYLLCLCVWMYVVRLFLLFRVYIAIIVAFLFPVMAGFCDQVGMQFSLSRVLYFFPYFLIGSLLANHGVGFDVFRRTNISKFLSYLFFSGLLFCLLIMDEIPVSIFYGSSGYGINVHDIIKGPILRLLIMAVGVFACFLLPVILPKSSVALERFGRCTLVIYLLHPFSIKMASYFGIFTLIYSHNAMVSVLFAGLFSFIICCVLGVDILNRHFCFFFQKIGDLIVRSR